MTVKAVGEDLLSSGIFSLPQAARLVRASPHAMRIWVTGQKDRHHPLIDSQLGRIGKSVAVSFTNLLELRFVAFCADAGVRLNEIRAILDTARKELGHPHPFATNIVFKTDGKKVFAELAKRGDAPDIFELRSKNYEMYPLVFQSFKNDVVFDPKGEAAFWRPRAKLAPSVIIHPAISFGHPVVQGVNVPTAAIANAVRVEGSAAAAAELFEIPVKQVREAVSFERHLLEVA